MNLHIIMKLYIIRLAIGFTALVACFLPQKAQALNECNAKCGGFLGIGANRCSISSHDKDVKCYCNSDNKPVCEIA